MKFEEILLSRHSRSWFLCAVLALLITGCGGSMPSSSLPESEKAAYVASRIDVILLNQQDARSAGLYILLRKDGAIVYSSGKGMADIGQGTSITNATVFELASVAKPITAIAVMQLVEAGRLSLDDSILKWLPALSPSWSAITVRHLLAHRSGVPDYISINTAIKNPTS